MRRVAVLTSGGDAPGMNAAIRAVVRAGLEKGWEMFGVRQGYVGLIAGNVVRLGARDVGGVMQLGGTFLGTARSREFKTEEGRCRALRSLGKEGIEGLIVIGGSGSQQGAQAFFEMGFPVVGVASTIDNDLYGSDITIGVDTALNIALEAIDRLKVTASSLERAFLVEVMGRDCGYLAMMAGIAGGAEAICIPEIELGPDQVAALLADSYRRGKPHAIVVVAEGAQHGVTELARHFEDHQDEIGFQLRATILGHVQRGGAPTAADRLLATWLGSAAVEYMAAGQYGILTGSLGGRMAATPLSEVVTHKKELDLRLLEIAGAMAK